MMVAVPQHCYLLFTDGLFLLSLRIDVAGYYWDDGSMNKVVALGNFPYTGVW